jgi:hypothetical protein
VDVQATQAGVLEHIEWTMICLVPAMTTSSSPNDHTNREALTNVALAVEGPQKTGNTNTNLVLE